MEVWLAFIITIVFSVFTFIVAYIGAALKRGEE